MCVILAIIMAKPYSFEPRRLDSRSSVDKSSYHSDADENRRYSERTDRTVNRNWCVCQHCSVMATVEECVCCRELDAVNSKLQPSVSCITQHDRFWCGRSAICRGPSARCPGVSARRSDLKQVRSGNSDMPIWWPMTWWHFVVISGLISDETLTEFWP